MEKQQTLPFSAKPKIQSTQLNFEQQQQQQNGQQKQEQNQNQDEDQQQDEDQDQDQFNQSHPKWRKIPQPKDTIKLFMIDFNQCDSKKCSGRKMQRFNLLKSIKDKKPKFKGIVLSAHGDQVISKEDLAIAKKSGICVIDCSWNRIQETGNLRFKNQRILPYVIAGNPVNYGKPFQLSCVQACATALCALNYVPQAEYIMSKFGWADGFWSLNPKITSYASCNTMQETQEMSEMLQQQTQQQNENCKYRRYDLSSSESSNQSQNEQRSQEENEQPKKIGERQIEQTKPIQHHQ